MIQLTAQSSKDFQVDRAVENRLFVQSVVSHLLHDLLQLGAQLDGVRVHQECCDNIDHSPSHDSSLYKRGLLQCTLVTCRYHHALSV